MYTGTIIETSYSQDISHNLLTAMQTNHTTRIGCSKNNDHDNISAKPTTIFSDLIKSQSQRISFQHKNIKGPSLAFALGCGYF